MVGLCLCILFGLLPGFANGADVPQTVTTGSIVFTGLRFEPLSVKTDSIIFTGLRFEPLSVKTGSIVFTGLSFEPQSVKTGSIVFTGLRQETTLGISESKPLFSQKEADASKTTKFGARAVKPDSKKETMPKETPTGFVPPSRESIKKDTGKKTTKTAMVKPNKLGARLVLKDHNVIKSISLKANESFDLVFFVNNAGDTKSDPFQYTITCKVLRGGPKCPVFSMSRTVYGIAPQKTHEIKLNGIAAPPGEYEVTVALKTGQLRNDGIKRVRLKVEPANMSTTPIKSGRTEEDNDKPRIKQISPIKPKQEIEQRQKSSQLHEY